MGRMTAPDAPVQRRLAAILAADVVGFSALMGRDEEGTLSRIKALRRTLLEPKVAEHRGRVFKTTGDGFLVEFASPVEAVRCAAAIQEALAATSQERGGALCLRIGINLGDILVEDDGDVYGDGVNVAARLEQLAEPGGVCLSAKVYEEVRDKLAYAFQDAGEQQVKNIARPVRAYRLTIGPKAPAAAVVLPALPLPDRPSIAVLPFANMSGDPEQEYFADGISEDVITALSKWRWLFVIARNSSFTYKGRSADIKQVGRELGVRYVLEGSIRKAGERVRVTAELVEADTGEQIWAERYDRRLDDIFGLQDEITSAVLTTLEPSLTAAEVARARRKPPDSLSAYESYLRALPELYEATADSFRRADALLTQAIALDPNYADALAALAYCKVRAALAGWGDWETVKSTARELARRAVVADPEHGVALANAAWVYAVTDGLHEAAMEMANRALRVHPSSAFVRAQCGWTFVYSGELDRAIEQFQQGLRLNPLDPRSRVLLGGIAAAHLLARRFNESVEWSNRTLQESRGSTLTLRYLAAALGHLGRIEEARAVVDEILALQPTSSLARSRGATPFRYPWMLDLYVEGLRLAGLPE